MADLDRCVDVLSDTIRGYKGIEEVKFDVTQNKLELGYDPRLIQPEAAQQLAQRVGEEAASLVTHCGRKSPAECARCVADMRQQLQQHFAAPPNTTFNQGQMAVAALPMYLSSTEVAKVTASYGSSRGGRSADHPDEDSKCPLLNGYRARNWKSSLLS